MRSLETSQRLQHCIAGLRNSPWWDSAEIPLAIKLENQHLAIRDEFEDLALSGRLRLHPQSQPGDYARTDSPVWRIFSLSTGGEVNMRNALEAPLTTQIISAQDAMTNHPMGHVYFSVLDPGGHVNPHCGPTNTRIRVHLGIRVPPESELRVGSETKQWTEGRCLVFNDCWEHEATNSSTLPRVVLLADTWHPEMTPSDRDSVTAECSGSRIEVQRQREGWYKDLSALKREATGAEAIMGFAVTGRQRHRSLEQTAHTVIRTRSKRAAVSAQFALAALNANTSMLQETYLACSNAELFTDTAPWDSIGSVLAGSDSHITSSEHLIDLVHLHSIAWRAEPSNRDRMNKFFDHWTTQDRESLIGRFRLAGSSFEATVVATQDPELLTGLIPFGCAASVLVTTLRCLARENTYRVHKLS
jgi:hypothetical protein